MNRIFTTTNGSVAFYAVINEKSRYRAWMIYIPEIVLKQIARHPMCSLQGLSNIESWI